MAKKNNKKQQNQSSPAATKESGKIRQREDDEINNKPSSAPVVEKKQSHQVINTEANANVLLLNLNSNPEQIYRQTLGKMLASTFPRQYRQSNNNNQKKEEETTEEKKEDESGEKDAEGEENKNTKKKEQEKKSPNHHQQNNEVILSTQQGSFFTDDQQSATMLIKFADKFAAKKFAQKLNHSQLFGSSSSHATVVPTSTLKPKYEPCALRITELSASSASNNKKNQNQNQQLPSFSLQQLQQYLSSNPGFLSVSRVASLGNNSNQQQQNQQNNNNNRCFIATYADSGASLQARALMSGRAFHGVHLLFERIEEEENEQIIPLV